MNWSFLFQSEQVSLMLMTWAENHPYLFTLIQITSPTLFVVLIIAGFNVVNGVFRERREWRRGR